MRLANKVGNVDSVGHPHRGDADDEPDGLGRIAAAMAAVRAAPPNALAATPVERVSDLLDGDGSLPPTDALVVELADGSRVALRPSGTEPKLKVYVEVVEPVGDDTYAAARQRGQARVDALIEAVATVLGVDSSCP